MQNRGSSAFAPITAAAARRHQCSLPTQRTRHAVQRSAIRSVCLQAKNAKRLQPPASWPRVQRSAIRGGSVITRATAGQSVVRASRGSAAPGSQRVVSRGARAVRAGGASHGARTSQQPTLRSGRYSAFMANRTTKSDTFRRSGARPNPVFNRTPCGSPRLALISFWAKRGLPQGAG